jgi:acetoin utilization protein AcuA
MERFLSSRDSQAPLRNAPDIKELGAVEEGALSIVSRCPPGFFSGLELDAGLGRFAHYSSIIQKLDVFEKVSREKDGRVYLALVNKKLIVGYAACYYPGADQRWSKLGELMYEMGAIEISRSMRKHGLAKGIFGAIMEDDFFEDKIAYMNGFSWHWDLDGSGLSMIDYRKMMLGFLRTSGFQDCYTNEPNIALREENFFMVRVGSRVSEEDRARFRDLRFGIFRK